MLKFECPHCHQHISGDDAWAGLTATCPTCSSEFVIPAKLALPPDFDTDSPGSEGLTVSHLGNQRIPSQRYGNETFTPNFLNPCDAGMDAPPGDKVSLRAWIILSVLLFGYGASLLQLQAHANLALSYSLAGDISETGRREIFAAHYYGEVAGYILMTVVTALIGTRWGLTAGFSGMAMASVACRCVNDFSMVFLLNFALGFFSGAVIPGAIQAVRERFPSPLRPLGIGFLLATGQVVSALSLPLVESISDYLGYRFAAGILSLPAFIAALVCALSMGASPAKETSTGFSKLAWVSLGTLVGGCLFLVPLLKLSTLQFNYLTKFLAIDFRSLHSMAAFTSLPAGGMCGALLTGVVAWIAIQEGGSPFRTRAVLLTVCGFMLVFVAFLGLTNNVVVIVLMGALSMFGCYGVMTLLNSAVADTVPARWVASGVACGALVVTLTRKPLLGAMNRLGDQGEYGLMFTSLGVTAALAWLVVALPAWFIGQRDAPSRRIYISEEEPISDAVSLTPERIGGWLILPAISLVLGSIVSVGAIVMELMQIQMMQNGKWQIDENAPEGVFALNILADWFVTLFGIIAAVLFFAKKRSTPRAIISLLITNIVIAGLFLIIYLVEKSQVLATANLINLLKAVVVAAIWIPYFSLSKRVKRTFVVF